MTFHYKNILASLSLAALLALGALGTTSCNKEFIDLNDPTRVPTTEGYNDSLSIVTAVTAAYASLQELYGKSSPSNRGIFLYAEVTSDNSFALTSGERLNEFNDFTLVSDNTHLQTHWLATYRAIARCNIVLSRAGAVKLTEATRNRFYAEVRFIRALTYFNAVRIWGDIPLVTGEIASIPDAYQFGRVPTEQVYALIEEDLAFAENNLPVTQTAANLGRATKGAATGLLGKVYLTEKKYQQAADKLQPLVTGTTYSLQTSYANIFATSNEMNSEILFAVRYSKGGLGIGSPFTNWFLPIAVTAINGGSGSPQQFNSVDPDLVAAFTASGSTDVRAAASYGTGTDTQNRTVYYTKKYIDTPTSSTDAENDWIVLRYADVLLMYAEAINKRSGPTAPALDAVNRVIRRSRNLPVTTANATIDLPLTTTQATLRDRLELERRLELNMEGHRWFDLVRTERNGTNRAIQVMNAFFARNASSNTIDSHDLLFPVPIQEIQTNPVLTQNPGY